MTGVITRSDREIHQQVLEELRWDSRVDETQVGVEVQHGIVTLTGTVESYGKKLAAQRAAHRVNGVLDVANDIEVKSAGDPEHTDTEIAAAVRESLKWDAFVPHESIRSTVLHGWVVLEGTVPSWIDREEAEQVVARLAGVRGVNNNLTVASPTAEPGAIHRAIDSALERGAEREAREIDVDISDGTVVLSGHVHSFREKQAVVGAAGHAPGVRKIVDHLKIDPYF